jgi:hypothetical protein
MEQLWSTTLPGAERRIELIVLHKSIRIRGRLVAPRCHSRNDGAMKKRQMHSLATVLLDSLCAQGRIQIYMCWRNRIGGFAASHIFVAEFCRIRHPSTVHPCPERPQVLGGCCFPTIDETRVTFISGFVTEIRQLEQI